jgi:putative hydrolase of the HAD superfamily
MPGRARRTGRYYRQMATGLRAVLFDSGGVLMQPKGGRWNPRADFELILTGQFPTLTPHDFAGAITAGDAFLAATAAPRPDDYHRVLLRALGIEPTEALLADLGRPAHASAILEVFPDVLPTLETLRTRGVPMAVVSDNVANLPEVHAALGLGGFFKAYAISAVLGCHKPDPRMYHHASDALGLPPDVCLFLDDDPRLVAAAIDLGYQGRAVIRPPGPAPVGVAAIATIDEILPLF